VGGATPGRSNCLTAISMGLNYTKNYMLQHTHRT
jgi:hypothetical protein